jgi:hypothetical protein
MADAMAESLNYASQKRRAVASRSYRVKISPVNGQNFSAGQTVNIDMPSNLAATYVNWNQCYLKFKVTATGGALTLDKSASCFISRCQAMTAGAQLFDCPSWNVLMNVLLDTDSGPGYKAGYGNILMGTRGSDPAGEVLSAGAANARTYCVPFALSSPFAMSTPHRLMPLSSSAPVQFKITLASIDEAGYHTAVTALTFEEVELVCVFTELSAAAEQQVQQMNGGQFNILANSWQAISTNMDAGATAVTSNIGISVSSLERVIVVHRPTKSLIGAAFSQSNRISNGLTEWQLLINGEAFPQRSIKNENKGAEIVAEYLLSDHSLVNFDKQSSFNVAIGLDGTTNYNGLDGASVGLAVPTSFTLDFANADGDVVGSNAAAGNIGSFFAGLELETGLSDGRSQRLYSGISTISSTVNYRGLYAGGADTGACEITFFLGYTVMLSLNSRGTNVWSISV